MLETMNQQVWSILQMLGDILYLDLVYGGKQT